MRTGAMMRNDWKSLRVGDRVRILRLPTLWNHPNYHVDPSTRRLYRRLIARKRSVRVFRIDEFGQPWIQGRAPRESEWWTLAIADDSWVRVKRRAKT
jgi:hypothetical protein